MTNKYYRVMYETLHIYKKYHVSYRYFKKASIKRLNEYKKLINESFEYLNTEGVLWLRKN